jgi:hypothetical protein
MGPEGDWVVSVGGERRWGECRRLNMVQILGKHVCKWKNETC